MGHRHYNGLKTTLLFASIFALLLIIGSVVAGGQYIWAFALLGVVVTGYGYWNSDKLAIRPCARARSARPSSRRCTGSSASCRPAARSRCRGCTSRRPMAPNAFATGRNPRNAAVCCTEGILQHAGRARAARRPRATS